MRYCIIVWHSITQPKLYWQSTNQAKLTRTTLINMWFVSDNHLHTTMCAMYMQLNCGSGGATKLTNCTTSGIPARTWRNEPRAALNYGWSSLWFWRNHNPQLTRISPSMATWMKQQNPKLSERTVLNEVELKWIYYTCMCFGFTRL